MLDGLDETDRMLVAHLRAGGTVAGFARENHYSTHWAKWKSRSLRQRYGAASIEELMTMADDDPGVSRADFDKLTTLVTRLGDAVDELSRARPAEQPAAQQVVRERELDVKDHAKALGLSLEDVERVKGEKEYERWLKFEERRLAELDAEEKANGTTEAKGLGDVIRDGLGGIRKP